MRINGFAEEYFSQCIPCECLNIQGCLESTAQKVNKKGIEAANKKDEKTGDQGGRQF